MRCCAGCSKQARFLSEQNLLCGECVKAREAAGAECTPLCMLCEDAAALIFCRNDNANLCAKCDADFHFSNPLAARHERVPLSAGACAAGTPTCEGMDGAEHSVICDAITADSLLPLVKTEPLDDFCVPLLAADSPNDSGSTLTVTRCSPVDVEQQQLAPQQPYGQQAAVKGEKEVDPFLEWDGALLDFGLELDAFEHEIMSNDLTTDAVVPIAEPSESSCCSGASGVRLPDGVVKAETGDGSASCYLGFPYAQSMSPMVPGTMAMTAPQVAYPMMSGAWAQHAVPQYAMMGMPNPQFMAASGWAAGYGAAFYGAYACPSDQITREARHQSIKRYREKRNKRIFEKTIRYQSRKAYAEIRPRIKGRFAKREEKSVDEGTADEEANDRTVPECCA